MNISVFQKWFAFGSPFQKPEEFTLVLVNSVEKPSDASIMLFQTMLPSLLPENFCLSLLLLILKLLEKYTGCKFCMSLELGIVHL